MVSGSPEDLMGKWRRGGMGAAELGWRLLSLAESAPAGELTAMAKWARAADLSQELRQRLFEGIGRNPAVNPEILRGILTPEALKDWQVCAGLADGLAEGGSARLEMIKGLFGRGQQRILRGAEGLALVRDQGFKGAMETVAAAGVPGQPGPREVGQSITADRVFNETLAMGATEAREVIEVMSGAKEGDFMAYGFSEKLTGTDPRGALDWLLTLPRETRSTIVSGVFQGSAAKDPEYTLEFLSRFPSSDEEQWNAVSALKDAFSKNDPERAAQCEALLAELQERKKAR